MRVPAAIAAKAVHPQRMVISWNGDGCFQMNGQELATAAQYGLAVLFVVIDNGMYGTIRMHQERHYPARVSGTRDRESRLRGAGARVRRAWRDRGDHGRVRARLRARGGCPAGPRCCT